MQRIQSDESSFSPAYAAEVAKARAQANVMLAQIKTRIAELLKSAGATAPDSNKTQPAGNHLIDSRPLRLLRGRMDPFGEILANHVRKTHKGGKYRMLACVTPDGTVKKALVLYGMPNGTSEQLQKAALKLRYQPAMKDGQPVEAWDQITGWLNDPVSFHR
jgi:hypothetical protein